MKAERKTKAQLVKELGVLKKRNQKLEVKEIGYKQAVKTLEESEKRFRNIFESSKDGIIFFDGQTRKIILGNRAMAKLLGCSKKDLIGRSIPSLHPPKEWPGIEKEFQKHVKGEISVSAGIPVVRKDGSVFYADINSSLITLKGRTYISAFFRDTTERRLAEMSLIESREQYRSLASAEDSMYLVDRESRFLFMNDAHLSRLGLSLEKVAGRSYGDFHSPEDTKRFRASIKEVLETKRSLKVEHHSERDQKYFLRTFSPIRDAQGKITAITVISKDITDHKQTEEALLESEARYRPLFENSDDAILLTAPDGRIFQANPSACRIFGHTEAEIIQEGRNGVVDETDPRLPVMLEERKRTGRVRGDLTFKRRDGQLFPGEMTSVVFRSKEGLRTCMIIRDITESKQKEEALRESEEKYRNLVERANDGIGIGQDGILHYANARLADIVGYSIEELVGKPFTNFFMPEEVPKVMGFYKRRMDGEDLPTIYETALRHKDGRKIDIEVNTGIINYKGKPADLVVSRDITERKRADVLIERNLRETRVRFDVSQALAGKETEDEVLDALIQQAGFYPQAYVAICTIDRQGGERAIILRRADSFESGVVTIVPIGTRFPASRFESLNRYSIDQPFVSNDIGNDERIDPASLELIHQAGASSFAFFPLTVGKEWMGFIATVAKPAHYFDKEKQHLYQTLAEQGAVALRAARLREQISESQQRFQGLVETISDWIWEINQDGVYTYVSPKIRDLLGVEPEEVLGKTPFDFMPPEEARRVSGLFETLKAARQPMIAFENAGLHKDGHLVVVETSGLPFFDGEGQFKGYRGVDRDITERMQTQKALQISEERFRIAAESSNDFIYEWDLNTGQLEWFGAATERLNHIFSEPPVTTAAFEKSIHPEDYERISKAVRRQVRYGEPYRQEYRLIGKTGDIFHIQTAGKCLRDESGWAYKWIGTTSDITERKRADEMLAIKENSIASAINAMGIGDLEGNLTYVNPSFLNLLGYKDDHEVLGKPVSDFWESEEHVKQVLEELNKHGFWVGELVAKRRDGSLFNAQVATSVVRDKTGNPVCLMGSFLDITERKQAEEALFQAEEKYRAIVENAVEGIFQTTSDGKFLMANTAVARFHGYDSPEELIATISNIGEQLYVHPEDRQRYRQVLADEGIVKGFENQYYRKDGTINWGSMNVRSVRDNEGRILYYEGTIEDITARKEAELGLQKSLEKLRKALGGIVQAMSLTVETRDPYTAGHQRRVADLSRAIAQEMGLPEDQVDALRMAGNVHDLGKISIPAEILSKPVQLSDIEFSLIKGHPQISYDILKDIDFNWPVAQIVLQHHERINGSGYPQGLSGKAIYLEARILAVADVVEAISSHRPYRPAFGIDVALEEIEKNKDILYDPEAVEACLRLFREKGFKFE